MVSAGSDHKSETTGSGRFTRVGSQRSQEKRSLFLPVSPRELVIAAFYTGTERAFY